MSHARSLVIALAVGTAVLTLSARPDAAPRDTPNTQSDDLFTQLVAGYTAGDTTIVNRTLRRDVDYLDIKREFEASLAQWHDWQFVQAGFVFEVVLAVVERDMASMPDVVSKTRAFITGRTDPIGANETRDAFELLWHRTMLALLQGAKQSRLADEYVHANASRVAAAPVADGSSRLIDPRLALEHAIITEQVTTPDALAFATLSRWVPLAIDPRDATIKSRVDKTLHELDEAVKIPETAAEASIRKAFVLHRLGSHDDALALLDAAGSRTRDRVLLYWIDLVRGRTLQAVGRFDAAADAYTHALQSWPDAQSPAVALSALCLLQDRRDEARRWAAMAQSRPADAMDPWWQYWQGDFRFISDWLGTLRRVARAGG